jgi:hypothetical protein
VQRNARTDGTGIAWDWLRTFSQGRILRTRPTLLGDGVVLDLRCLDRGDLLLRRALPLRHDARSIKMTSTYTHSGVAA